MKTFRSQAPIVGALAFVLLAGACASALPAGAPPIDPYGPPTAMNAPDSAVKRSKDTEQAGGGDASREAGKD